MILDVRRSKSLDYMFGVGWHLVGDSYSDSGTFLLSTWGQKILEFIYNMGQEESKWVCHRINGFFSICAYKLFMLWLMLGSVQYLTSCSFALVLRYSWTMLKSEIKLYGFICRVWRDFIRPFLQLTSWLMHNGIVIMREYGRWLWR